VCKITLLLNLYCDLYHVNSILCSQFNLRPDAILYYIKVVIFMQNIRLLPRYIQGFCSSGMLHSVWW